MSWLFGFWTYLLLQTRAWMVAGATGIWLFYVQHQFEDAYWERDEHGTTPRPRCRAARTTSCRGSCSGSPETSASITSIT